MRRRNSCRCAHLYGGSGVGCFGPPRKWLTDIMATFWTTENLTNYVDGVILRQKASLCCQADLGSNVGFGTFLVSWM